eukprot:m.119120 g.119120  ORF g.119120 m.119120 type:complete len:132 (+) comp13671_c0_seq1:389-784(+)
MHVCMCISVNPVDKQGCTLCPVVTVCIEASFLRAEVMPSRVGFAPPCAHQMNGCTTRFKAHARSILAADGSVYPLVQRFQTVLMNKVHLQYTNALACHDTPAPASTLDTRTIPISIIVVTRKKGVKHVAGE